MEAKRFEDPRDKELNKYLNSNGKEQEPYQSQPRIQKS